MIIRALKMTSSLTLGLLTALLVALTASQNCGEAEINLKLLLRSYPIDSNSQNFLVEDLNETENLLYRSFSEIYGHNFKLHKRFFESFFQDLKSYVTLKNTTGLQTVLREFFKNMRSILINIIENSRNFSYDSKRIECLSMAISSADPFDGVDVRMSTRLQSTYGSVEKLLRLLVETQELLTYIRTSLPASEACVKATARLRNCDTVCRRSDASTQVPFCTGTCSSILKNCFRFVDSYPANDLEELDQFWNVLSSSFDQLIYPNERVFDFPSINKNLFMDISEAITNFQTKYSKSKSQIYGLCSQGKVRRSASLQDSNLFNWRTPRQASFPSGASPISPKLSSMDYSRLLYELKGFFVQQKNLFANSTDKLCTHVPVFETHSWNCKRLADLEK
ncbi:hypothetical protein Ciccas_001803 [Cichlidogyrus casuarinus]|uniref:Glypican-5 n=1 Tax=Cichlidogyrus casuarinus TaxID=1844966 RepID=A0ABD2QJJ8_9PLAT